VAVAIVTIAGSMTHTSAVTAVIASIVIAFFGKPAIESIDAIPVDDRIAAQFEDGPLHIAIAGVRNGLRVAFWHRCRRSNLSALLFNDMSGLGHISIGNADDSDGIVSRGRRGRDRQRAQSGHHKSAHSFPVDSSDTRLARRWPGFFRFVHRVLPRLMRGHFVLSS